MQEGVSQDTYDRVEEQNIHFKKVMAETLNVIHKMDLPNIAKEQILSMLIPDSV